MAFMYKAFLFVLLVPVSLSWSPVKGPLRRHGPLKARQSVSDDGRATSLSSDAGQKSDNYLGRRQFVSFGAMTALTFASTCRPACAMNGKSRTQGYAVQKTDEEWKSTLSPTQYNILRLGATERPYSSVLEGEKREGAFVCAGCGTKLFDSKQKFKSGTGWPSFARALEGVEVENVNQVTANLVGAELRCGTCGGHLGDVFNDGFLFVGTPAFTSGKRYCIDGAALVFQPANGEAAVSGDLPAPNEEQSLPSWLEPRMITPLKT